MQSKCYYWFCSRTEPVSPSQCSDVFSPVLWKQPKPAVSGIDEAFADLPIPRKPAPLPPNKEEQKKGYCNHLSIYRLYFYKKYLLVPCKVLTSPGAFMFQLGCARWTSCTSKLLTAIVFLPTFSKFILNMHSSVCLHLINMVFFVFYLSWHSIIPFKTNCNHMFPLQTFVHLNESA